MVFTTVLMPGLMIYILYTFMGKGLMREFSTDEFYVASAYVQNMPEELSPVLRGLSVDWTEISIPPILLRSMESCLLRSAET